MAFKYSCFISYNRELAEFAKSLKESIEQELRPLGISLPVYLDLHEHEPGDDFTGRIADALHHSVTFLSFYTVQYISRNRDFCTRELASFLAHQEDRFAQIKAKDADANGFKLHQILPVIFRLNDKRSKLPTCLSQVHWAANLTEVSANDKHASLISQESYKKSIKKIAEKIDDLHFNMTKTYPIEFKQQSDIILLDKTHPMVENLFVQAETETKNTRTFPT